MKKYTKPRRLVEVTILYKHGESTGGYASFLKLDSDKDTIGFTERSLAEYLGIVVDTTKYLYYISKDKTYGI